MSRNAKAGSSNFTNVDIVLCAAYQLNAQNVYVATEDIAIISNQIAPGRFSWEKHKDQIDLENIRKRLFDARKEGEDGYLVGNNKDGWLLTKNGVEYAKSLSSSLGDIDLSRIKVTSEEKRRNVWVQREKSRILASDVYAKFRDEGLDSITKAEAENFFNLDEYIIGTSRARKVDRLVKASASDPSLAPAVNALAKLVLRE